MPCAASMSTIASDVIEIASCSGAPRAALLSRPQHAEAVRVETVGREKRAVALVEK